MSLLDKKLRQYYITKQYWDFGGGKIYDKNQNEIGSISNKLFSINKRFEIRDKNKSLLAYIETKPLSFRKKQVIRDSKGRILFTVIRKKMLFKLPKFYLKNETGQDQFVASGKDFSSSYNFIDLLNKKSIANISKHKKDFLLLQISKLEINRLALIAMIISTENILNKTFLLSDTAGYGRFIMRLRPFGPGIRKRF